MISKHEKSNNHTQYAFTDRDIDLANTARNKRDKLTYLFTGAESNQHETGIIERPDCTIIELPAISNQLSPVTERIKEQLKHFETINQQRDGTSQLKFPIKILAPYKLDAWHWNVLEIVVNQDGKIACKRYDTDGFSKPVEENVFSEIKNPQNFEKLAFQSCNITNQAGNRKEYSSSIQRNVNCGLGAGAIMHDLKKNQRTYDDLNTILEEKYFDIERENQNYQDIELRKKVDSLVFQNIEPQFSNFCKPIDESQFINKLSESNILTGAGSQIYKNLSLQKISNEEMQVVQAAFQKGEIQDQLNNLRLNLEANSPLYKTIFDENNDIRDYHAVQYFFSMSRNTRDSLKNIDYFNNDLPNAIGSLLQVASDKDIKKEELEGFAMALKSSIQAGDSDVFFKKLVDDILFQKFESDNELNISLEEAGEENLQEYLKAADQKSLATSKISRSVPYKNNAGPSRDEIITSLLEQRKNLLKKKMPGTVEGSIKASEDFFEGIDAQSKNNKVTAMIPLSEHLVDNDIFHVVTAHIKKHGSLLPDGQYLTTGMNVKSLRQEQGKTLKNIFQKQILGKGNILEKLKNEILQKVDSGEKQINVKIAMCGHSSLDKFPSEDWHGCLNGNSVAQLFCEIRKRIENDPQIQEILKQKKLELVFDLNMLSCYAGTTIEKFSSFSDTGGNINIDRSNEDLLSKQSEYIPIDKIAKEITNYSDKPFSIRAINGTFFAVNKDAMPSNVTVEQKSKLDDVFQIRSKDTIKVSDQTEANELLNQFSLIKRLRGNTSNVRQALKNYNKSQSDPDASIKLIDTIKNLKNSISQLGPTNTKTVSQYTEPTKIKIPLSKNPIYLAEKGGLRQVGEDYNTLDGTGLECGYITKDNRSGKNRIERNLNAQYSMGDDNTNWKKTILNVRDISSAKNNPTILANIQEGSKSAPVKSNSQHSDGTSFVASKDSKLQGKTLENIRKYMDNIQDKNDDEKIKLFREELCSPNIEKIKEKTGLTEGRIKFITKISDEALKIALQKPAGQVFKENYQAILQENQVSPPKNDDNSPKQ